MTWDWAWLPQSDGIWNQRGGKKGEGEKAFLNSNLWKNLPHQKQIHSFIKDLS